MVSHNEMLLEIETLLVKATELQKRYEEGLLRINELTDNPPQINKDVLDYVRTILLWEDKKLVEFIEISKVSFQSSKYRYRILEKDTYINKE